MEMKSRILMVVISLSVVISVALSFYFIMTRGDYIVEAQAECDPSVNRCFVHVCDPSGEECSGDAATDTSFYSIVRRKANMVPACDITDENCVQFECGNDEKDCEEVYCDERTKRDGDECNDPERYLLDNPPAAEEGAECDSTEDSGCGPDLSIDPAYESDQSSQEDAPVSAE